MTRAATAAPLADDDEAPDVGAYVEGPTSHGDGVDVYHLDENPGALDGPSSFESCGTFPYDEVVTSFGDEPTPPEPPTVTALAPPSVVVGVAGTVAVTGTGLTDACVASVDGVPQASTAGAGSLSFDYTGAVAGTSLVTVNDSATGMTSAGFPLEVTAAG